MQYLELLILQRVKDGFINSITICKTHSAISEETGKTPLLVVSGLHRSKLDPNRFKDDAAQYNAVSEKAYDIFHG